LKKVINQACTFLFSLSRINKYISEISTHTSSLLKKKKKTNLDEEKEFER